MNIENNIERVTGSRIAGNPDRWADMLSLAYPLLYALAGFIIAWWLNFHQFHNDFWDTFFIARHMSPQSIQSWYSPFFPILYNLFLKAIMGHGFPVVPAIIANLGFAVAFLYIVRALFKTVLSPIPTLVTLVILSIFPRLFWYLNAAGADPASMVFFTLGALLIVRQPLRTQPSNPWVLRYLGAGLLMGLGALCRYHVLVGSVLFLTSFWFWHPGWRRRIFVAGAGLFLGYLPQILLSVVTGHGVLSTGYGVANVYALMYKMSYYQTLTLELPSSIFALIQQNPVAFIKGYAKGIIGLSMIFVPPLAALIFERDKVRRRFCRAIFTWTAVYALFAAISTSDRAPLIALSFAAVCGALAILSAVQTTRIQRSPWMRRLVWCCIGLTGIFFLGRVAVGMIRWQNNEQRITAIDRFVVSQQVQHVTELFTTDFNLYIRSLRPYMPYFNGGAPRWGTYGYNEEYPEFAVESLTAFAADCRKRGVRFVILTQPARLLSEKLGDLYDGTIMAPDFMMRKEIDESRIFEVVLEAKDAQ